MRKLVKFVSELGHAEMLLDGFLYMRPVSFYHGLEQGQGDIREGWLHGRTMMYQDLNLPIYCMYTINDDDIINESTVVSAKCIEDFKCKNGYAVVLEYSAFERRLPSINRNGYCIAFGEVNYRIPQQSELVKLLNEL